ncbi:hypothetical protein CEP51_011922 [Fusarium floridanum]|nr:hypothetical protein CEP51_011922 [Fusarium floridanum]
MSLQMVEGRKDGSEEFCSSPPPMPARQNIEGRNMDHIKLITMLRVKFASEYQVQMMHSTYSIQAPRRLSFSEIAQCRRTS